MSGRDFLCAPINYSIYFIDTIDSTNNFLKNNYKAYPDKTALIANKQTAGRGRFDRVWISDDDICFSILFKKFHYNNIIAPLAVALALKDLNVDAGIKWPNDILINNKKVAGILIEDLYSNDFLASVVGIGMNMHDKASFDAIGLTKFTDLSKKEIINSVINHYNFLLELRYDELVKLYKKYSMVIDKKVIYKGQEYTACDITENGHLVLLNENMKLVISSNEIDVKGSLILNK